MGANWMIGLSEVWDLLNQRWAHKLDRLDWYVCIPVDTLTTAKMPHLPCLWNGQLFLHCLQAFKQTWSEMPNQKNKNKKWNEMGQESVS